MINSRSLAGECALVGLALASPLATAGAAQSNEHHCFEVPAAGYITKRISNVGPNGEDGVLTSLPKGASHPAASNTGTWIVWDSGFANHPEGYNGSYQVRVSNSVPNPVPPSVLISRDPATDEPGNNHSDFADISGTGRFIVFPSMATNLGATGGGEREVYVADRDPFENGFDGQDFLLERVSESADGVPSGGKCKAVSISNNGRYVTFSVDSPDPEFHPLANGFEQVYRKDRKTGDLVMVSQIGGVAANHISTRADISVGGRFVSFVSLATNLPLGNGLAQTYLCDFDPDLSGDHSPYIQLVSSPDGGVTAGNQDTLNQPSVSQKGDVVFASYATNLVPGDTNGISDVFLKVRGKKALRRISLDSQGQQATNGLRFSYPSFAGSGTMAVYTYHNPLENDLSEGDSQGQSQLFAHNMATGKTVMVSTLDRCGLLGADNPAIPNFMFDFTGGNTEVPFIGLNAPVPFMTLGNNLDPDLPNGDQNDARDVYVRVINF